MSKTVYIAGPMRGIREFNFPAFFTAQDRLEERGYTTVNPAGRDLRGGFDPSGMDGNEDLAALGFDLREALAWDTHKIASDCDAICVLPGWEKSSGARAEVALAHALGLYVGPPQGFIAGDKFAENLRIDPTTRPSGTLKEKPKPRLIGIGGHLAAGKDAAADYLVEEHGFVKLNMSEPLHEAMLALDPYVPINAHEAGCLTTTGAFARYSALVNEVGYTDAKKNPEVRRLLQNLGTEVGRKMVDEDIWVRIALGKIEALLAKGSSVVITGVRFKNELGMIEGAGGQTWWVMRPGHEPQASAAAHASEATLDRLDFDRAIVNESTLGDLYRKVNFLVTSRTSERKAA